MHIKYKICLILFSVSKVIEICQDDPFALRWQITIRTNAICITCTTSLTFANSPPHLEHHMVECQYPNLSILHKVVEMGELY